MRQSVSIVLICVVFCASCGIQKPVIQESIRPELLNGCVIAEEEAIYRDWRDIFTDVKLQELIDEALLNNAEVRTAEQSVTQASILLRIAKLNYLPSFSVNPGGGLSKAGTAEWTKTYELPLTMQWQINLAGGEMHQKEAMSYAWMQSKERLRYSQMKLMSSIANAYYTLIMIDEQIHLTGEHVKVQEETTRALQVMKEVGRSNDLAVQQSEAILQETKTSLNDLEQNRIKVEQALNLLLGRTPDVIERSDIHSAGQIMMDAESPVSLEMLASRPDVKEVEYALRASFANSKVARSRFYPSLQITSSGSWTNNLGEIVNPGKMLLNLIGSLTQPLFMQGQIKGQFEIAESQQEQAQIAFEQSLLQAGGEVCVAMAECRNVEKKIHSRRLQVEASEKAFENSKLMMSYASSNYLELLTAQATYLNAKLLSTADWLEAQQSAINLFNALCPYCR